MISAQQARNMTASSSVVKEAMEQINAAVIDAAEIGESTAQYTCTSQAIYDRCKAILLPLKFGISSNKSDDLTLVISW